MSANAQVQIIDDANVLSSTDENNIRAWVKAGVCAVGLGSKLISKDVLKNENYDLLYENTLRALKIARGVLHEAGTR